VRFNCDCMPVTDLFEDHGCKLYGDEFAVYNVHSIIHSTDNVEKFGCVDNISCFHFENHLHKLKKPS
jgi:hypothetical protein